MAELRKGIGALILNQNNDLIVFQRIDYKENWQGVEGGIEKGDDTEKSLYKEVEEEIGLKKEDFVILNETKEFIPYFFKNGEIKFNFKGQEKKFYLIKLMNDKKFCFDSSKEKAEFCDFKVVSPAELVELVPDFKKEFYTKILKEFNFI